MNIREIIYLNCGETYEFMIDHRSYAHNLSSCEICKSVSINMSWEPDDFHIVFANWSVDHWEHE